VSSGDRPDEIGDHKGVWAYNPFYAERDQTRREHPLELQEQFGYRAFTVAH